MQKTAFRTPFSREYWRSALLEMRDVRMLALAALLVAMRVALKSVMIPIADNLFISVGFLPNALGAMLCGPYLALMSGAASDILGWLLFPKGAFFPLFTVVEMLGSLLFALFLYGAKPTILRVALSKLSVNVICNILLTPIFLSMMYGKAIQVYLVTRIAKNLLLLPVEAALLYLLLRAVQPAIRSLNLRRGS